MRIIVQRSGGYAGTSETYDLDTEKMDNSSAAELLRLVDDAEAAAKRIAQTQQIGADFLKYEVTLSEKDRQRTWKVVDDGSVALEPVRQLADYLSRHSGR